MIIPTNYTPVQIAIPDDRECETILSIWTAICYYNNTEYSYVTHVDLARKYNLIYTLIKTDVIDELKLYIKSMYYSNYTIISITSAENMNFYKLNKRHYISIEEENDAKGQITYEGNEYWFKHGLNHRDNDKPAKIHADGTKIWYQNGLCHRNNDLPAIIYSDGSQCWYQNGKRHRDNDLPAFIYSNGTQEWWKNGKYHRDNDLPAIVNPNGTKIWYKNGLIHRDNDLPAIIYSSGTKEWWKNGKIIITPV